MDVNGDIFAAGSIVTESTAPITNAVRVTGEFMLTEDNELDYTSSLTDAMAAATITITELPANTIAVLAYIKLTDTGRGPFIQWARSSGGTQSFIFQGAFADGGSNTIQGMQWMPTENNTIRIQGVVADTTIIWKIVGYKVGE